LQLRFTLLSETLPQEKKYSWQPAEGVHSMNELFLHVVASGFNFPTMKGTPAAPGFTARGFEQSTTDKAQVVSWPK